LDEPLVLPGGPRAQMHERARTEHEAERGGKYGRARPLAAVVRGRDQQLLRPAPRSRRRCDG
jgi:hypothetical protein